MSYQDKSADDVKKLLSEKVDYAFYGTEVCSVEKYADRIEIKYSDGKKFVFTFQIVKQ